MFLYSYVLWKIPPSHWRRRREKKQPSAASPWTRTVELSTAIKQPGIDTAARDRSRATLNFTFAIATSPPRRPGSKRSCRASAQPPAFIVSSLVLQKTVPRWYIYRSDTFCASSTVKAGKYTYFPQSSKENVMVDWSALVISFAPTNCQ